jgi:hypothetical protein
MSPVESRRTPVVPPPAAPTTLEESGLSLDLLTQLVLKALHFGGDLSGSMIGKRLGVRFQVIEPALEFLKAQRHCEIAGSSLLGGIGYRYRITDAGRTRAALFLEHSHYVGMAPVPIGQYQQYMREFARLAPKTATKERVRQAFSHLVLSDRVLDQIGPAVNAAHSLFVYGPPGNGKTVISQAIGDLLDGAIAIPHALEVEGNIIRMFDPVIHESLEPPVEQAGMLDEGPIVDHRWVLCRRPVVLVGGELTIEALDLSFNELAGFYRAPVQAIANGGMLVIDDFGRQQCDPRQLLNRWIVPLESRVDYLTLQSGHKFEMPFAVLLVLATNVKPTKLVDEAFLRRIHYKVFAESPERAAFVKIFENYCRTVDVPFARDMVEGVLDSYFRPHRIPLRGCQPRDLIEQALAVAEYSAQDRRLTPELLASACAGYFLDDQADRVEFA